MLRRAPTTLLVRHGQVGSGWIDGLVPHSHHHLHASCTAAVDQSFAITAVDSKRAVVIGSSEVVRKPPEGDCAAVELNMVVRPDGKGYVRISMPVSNQSSRGFRATVKLRLGDLHIPVPVGLVHPGEIKTKDLRIRLASDLKVVNATLLIGPQ